MSKELKFVLLLDCYGEILTKKQRETMELYYCEDLSLAEISEPRGITRQAVRDGIKRSEQALLEMEEKLGFAARLGKMRDCFEKISEISGKLDNSEISKELNIYIEQGLSLL